MADDRMKNDDLDRNLGRAGQQDDEFGRQTPGRNPQDEHSTGQRDSGQKNEPRHMEDDFDSDVTTKKPAGEKNR